MPERLASRARARKVAVVGARVHASDVDPCCSNSEYDVSELAQMPPERDAFDTVQRLRIRENPFQFGADSEELVCRFGIQDRENGQDPRVRGKRNAWQGVSRW